MKRIVLVAGLLAASACQDNSPVATVAPATGAELAAYSEKITDRADRRKDASLYEYFCKNALSSPCPADISNRLEPYLGDDKSRVDLADAFARLKAASVASDPTAPLSDEAYVKAAYQVALGRDPDPSGCAANLKYVEDTGDRGGMMRSLLQSAEFKTK